VVVICLKMWRIRCAECFSAARPDHGGPPTRRDRKKERERRTQTGKEISSGPRKKSKYLKDQPAHPETRVRRVDFFISAPPIPRLVQHVLAIMRYKLEGALHLTAFQPLSTPNLSPINTRCQRYRSPRRDREGRGEGEGTTRCALSQNAQIIADYSTGSSRTIREESSASGFVEEADGFHDPRVVFSANETIEHE